jgi:hypothetical protein
MEAMECRLRESSSEPASLCLANEPSQARLGNARHRPPQVCRVMSRAPPKSKSLSFPPFLPFALFYSSRFTSFHFFSASFVFNFLYFSLISFFLGVAGRAVSSAPFYPLPATSTRRFLALPSEG